MRMTLLPGEDAGIRHFRAFSSNLAHDSRNFKEVEESNVSVPTNWVIPRFTFWGAREILSAVAEVEFYQAILNSYEL